jgi:GMP synthase (glutamine-hydrolysing)
MKDKIAVLDFGGQYAHLIANRVRRLGVFTEILHPTDPVESFSEFKGIIFSGGPSSVYAADCPEFNRQLLDIPVPKLGICYGHQLINHCLGGEVTPGTVKEYGVATLQLVETDHPLLQGIPARSAMWMSHGDRVSRPAPGFRTIASTDDCREAAVADDTRQVYGIQFHPEVTHSVFGNQLLKNFIAICACETSWNTASYLAELQEKIRTQVGDKNVFLLVSGGVDSTVAFVLLNKILGKDRVLGLHIDNGLMRFNESDAVEEFLAREQMDNMKVADASELFLRNLTGVSVPEEKRKIIGDTFLDVKDQEIEKLDLDPEHWLLAQGTIYPDTIESGGTKNADVIKTHHNRVAAIMELLEQGKIIEPLADLYKDEVRALGEELGIPKPLVWRHPFPGPGLGVRLLCNDSPTGFPATDPNLDAFLAERNLAGKILPIKSVGVQGDARTYAHPFALQSAMPWKSCEALSTTITNRFASVNRVIYQAGPESPVDFQVRELFCTREPLDFLRKVDDICTAFLMEHALYDVIWQMPVVLLPLLVSGKPVIVIRPVCSSEAMTANFYEMDQALLGELWRRLEANGVGALLYDVTHKPPATIEWE